MSLSKKKACKDKFISSKPKSAGQFMVGQVGSKHKCKHLVNPPSGEGDRHKRTILFYNEGQENKLKKQR
jgi:hypothetical protein